MAKVLKTAALVVGAVALIATGVGALAAPALAGTVTVAGVSTGTLLAASAGLSVASSLLMKKPGGVQGGSQTEFRADPNAGVPYVMGLTGTAGNIVKRSPEDGFGSNSKNDINSFVVILSGAGPIKEIVSFTSDKEAVTFDAAGNASGKWADVMQQRTQLGACPEPGVLQVQSGSSASPTGWTAAHKLSGLAAALWRLRYDSKKKVFYSNGVPQPLWTLKGVLCYDPRKDSTRAGGSGTHRWNDEGSWEYSDNPYLHALTWCIGRHQNGKRVMGLGAPIDQIIVSQFAEGASIAEANNWKLGGVIYSRPDTKWNNLKLMLQAGAGEPLRVGARIGCRINTPRVSLGTITQADIVGEAQLSTMQPLRSRLNTVTPRYRSADHDYEIVPADPVQVASYVAEDGDQKSKEIEYTLVQDVNQAATLARYDIEDSREFGPGTFPLKPAFLNYKAGDCLTLNIPDVAGQKVLLLTREIEPATSVVTFGVRSESDGKHAFALGQTGHAPPTPSVTIFDPSVAAPPASDWVLSGATMTANGVSIPALVVSGSVGNNLADAAVFDFRTVDATGTEPIYGEWVSAGIDAPTMTRKEIAGVTPGTSYQVSVRYRVHGVIGDRLILGPATSGSSGYTRGAFRVTSLDPAYPVSSDDESIAIVTTSAVLDDGRALALPSHTVGGLDEATNYALFWNLDAGAYEVEAYPATTRMASSSYAFIGWQSTLNADGTAPAGDTPPPGWGGGGYTPNMAMQ